MLDLICYLIALVLAALAVFSGPPLPSMDRTRLLAASFAAYLVPFLVHATERV